MLASVRVAGDDSECIFVVASDIGSQKRLLWQSVAVFAGISVVTLLIAGWTGYLVTGRLLQPLGTLRAATEEITVEDLRYRVPVPEERSEERRVGKEWRSQRGQTGKQYRYEQSDARTRRD